MNTCDQCKKGYWVSNDPLGRLCQSCWKNPSPKFQKLLEEHEEYDKGAKKFKTGVKTVSGLIFLLWLIYEVVKSRVSGG